VVAQAQVRVQPRLLLLAIDQGLEVVQVLEQMQPLLQGTVQAPMKEEAQDQVHDIGVTKDTTDA
jgi:hypothetical protein